VTVCVDFSDTSFDQESGRTHNFGVLRVLDTSYDVNGLPILPVIPDVGVPLLFPIGTVSGWDMRSIYWQYDDMYVRDHGTWRMSVVLI
jgi:hypothetical protein